ncbi:hypothetical protein [Paenibacillus luteus]|uniref:hypothetical protein n=1 Tax=Paenibacillus luteus TaxID=2545753 RepID=UPI00114239CA|nr:hypothetical protein [Paenibacillus luteus]
MIVFSDGNYETGDWLTADTYPERECFVVEEGSELAAKVIALYPYYTLDIVDNVLVDVTPRDKTPEEEAAENAPAPKSPEQIRIETLEYENTALQTRLADVELALIEIFGGVA